MKFGSKSIAIGLLVLGLVLVNYLASSVPVRIDATAGPNWMPAARDRRP